MTQIVFAHSAFANKLCEGIFSIQRPYVSKSPLFQDKKSIDLQITSDFEAIHKISQRQSFQNSADKSKPIFYLQASVVDLQNPSRIFNARIRARGNSSLFKGEATFPKLRLEFDDAENLSGTVFSKSRNLRINTHVNTNPKKRFTLLGRVNGEIAPLREGLAYSLANELGIMTPEFRLANIEYIDSAKNTILKKRALLLESDKKMSERFESDILDDVAFASESKLNIDPNIAVQVFMFHKLIGNDDFDFRVREGPVSSSMGGSYRPIYNTTILKKADGQLIPIASDFDMSTIVTGYETILGGLYDNKYFNLNSHEQSLFVTKFSSLKQKFTKAELDQAIKHFKTKKNDLYNIVNKADVDSEGRSIALLHLNTFFENIDAAMNFHMIASEKVPLYKDVEQTHPALRQDPIEGELTDPGFLRPGTPVIILGEEGGLYKVAILNINYDLLPGESVVGYIPKTAKIAKTLPKKFIGKVDNRDLISTQ